MKKIYILILIILLTGCTKYRDLNNVKIVSNIIIYNKKNKYYVIYQEVYPTSNNYKYIYYIRSAKKLNNAIKKLNNKNNNFYLKKVNYIIVNHNTNLNKIKKIYKNNKIIYYEGDYKKLFINHNNNYFLNNIRNKKETIPCIKYHQHEIVSCN